MVPSCEELRYLARRTEDPTLAIVKCFKWHTDESKSEVLPGIRHIRTPFVVGALWLTVLWMCFGRAWPNESTATGLWADVYRLGGDLGRPVILAVLGPAAYLVGSRMLWLLRLVHDFVRAWARRTPPRWWTRLVAPDGLSPEIRRLVGQISDSYPNPGETDGGKAQTMSVFRAALDISVAVAKYRWPADAPDLYQEYDRRESERDFSHGIALPLILRVASATRSTLARSATVHARPRLDCTPTAGMVDGP